MRLPPALVVAVVAVTVALAGLPPAESARAERDATLWTNQPRHKASGGGSNLADLAERARPAVVHVRGLVEETSASPEEAGKTSIGTGFIIHKAGFIVT